MIINKNYENLNILHENTMPERAYYIPASEKIYDLVLERTKSDRMVLLNGEWDFRYHKSVYDLKDNFFENNYSTDGYDKIPVPNAWQMYGYDYHQYTNVRYPFPFDPPYIPNDNPCAEYVLEFEYKKDKTAPCSFLNFEGVDSCFFVWLNGKYIGYSQVTHMTSEFDVSDIIVDGKNRLAVLVLKWCEGSYLEDQDKFRMSGIIRDVYILNRPAKAVYDYKVVADVDTSKVSVDVTFLNETNACIYIEDKEKNIISKQTISKNGEVCFDVSNPILWNAENPTLYTLVIETEYETIVDHVGFRKIEIKENVLYINGKNIKFRGVNRHESDPVTGPVVSMEQIIKDMTIMKEHNINAIRTSHYPNVPYFYELCDMYGFYVIDEADLEAHGPINIYSKEKDFFIKAQKWGEKLTDNPEWESSIVDRVKLMVERDKNRPSIIIWSMGNEAAYGCCIEKELEVTKEMDATRPTQYESSIYYNHDKEYDFSNIDIYGMMYAPIEDIEKYVKGENKKPYMLVEYSHAMGNGPGDLEDYHKAFYEYEGVCGGFVWEWCDHAIYKGETKQGKKMYYYGGDHKEKFHDGNFCVDGLCYPDRTPSTGLKEYKNVYRPVRVKKYNQEKGILTFHNYYEFDNLKDKVSISYIVNVDGQVLASGELLGIDCKPGEDVDVEFLPTIPKKGKVYVRFIYKSCRADGLVEKGHELGFDEVRLYNEDGTNQMLLELKKKSGKCEVSVDEDDSTVRIYGDEFEYVIDKRTGLFRKLECAGMEYLNSPMEINIWRAPTDNDRNIVNEWNDANYGDAYILARDISVSSVDGQVCVNVTAAIVAAYVQRLIDLGIKWKIDKFGNISCNMHAKVDEEIPTLPRFGIMAYVKKDFNNVSYYGMGPIESYIDKHQACYHDLFECEVKDLHEDYIKPQENGSHYDSDYVQLSSDCYNVSFSSDKTFSFNVSPYSIKELGTKKHNYELIEDESTVICIDYKMTGIGSNSCGPALDKKYRLDEKEFDFNFKIVPNKKC